MSWNDTSVLVVYQGEARRWASTSAVGLPCRAYRRTTGVARSVVISARS